MDVQWRIVNSCCMEMQLHLTESPKSSSYQFKLFSCMCVCLVTLSCPFLCNPLDYSPPGSSVHGTFQAKIQKKKKTMCICMEWVAISFFRGSSRFSPGDQTCITCVSCIAGGFFTSGTIGEAPIWQLESTEKQSCNLPVIIKIEGPAV